MPRDYFGNLPITAAMGFSRDVLVLEDCEGTFTWGVAGSGGDDIHEFATAAAWQGTYGMHLKTLTTGSAQNDATIVSKLFDYPAAGLLIARSRLAPVNVAATQAIVWQLTIDDGAQQYQAAFKLAPSTSKVYYANAAGTYVELTSMATTFVASTWYQVEIAIDCLAHKWLRARFNGWTSDLSAISLYNAAATSGRRAYLYLAVQASAAGPGDMYADNIVVHQIPEA